MIKKRIIAAVVVKNDRAVQSFAFNKFLLPNATPAFANTDEIRFLLNAAFT